VRRKQHKTGDELSPVLHQTLTLAGILWQKYLKTSAQWPVRLVAENFTTSPVYPTNKRISKTR
jgi:hypothetical protein